MFFLRQHRLTGHCTELAELSSARFSAKNKRTGKPVLCFGGEGEIRTLELFLAVTRFPVARARPTTRLLHLFRFDSVKHFSRVLLDNKYIISQRSRIVNRKMKISVKYFVISFSHTDRRAFSVKHPHNFIILSQFHGILFLFIINRNSPGNS